MGACEAGLERQKVFAFQDAEGHYSVFCIALYLYQLRSGRLDISQFPLGRKGNAWMHCVVYLHEPQALRCEQRGKQPRRSSSRRDEVGLLWHSPRLSSRRAGLPGPRGCILPLRPSPKARIIQRGLSFLPLSHRQLSSRLDVLIERFRVQRITSLSLSSVPESNLLLPSCLTENSTPPQTPQLTWLAETPLLKLMENEKCF